MVYNKIYAQIGEERHIVLDPINYQYDVKQILVISGETVPDYYEADVCNVGDTATLTMIGTAADGVEIPDRFFRDGRNVLVYVVIPGTGGDVQTRYDITIPSDERGERTDIELDEDQQTQADSLIAALNDGVGRAETAAGDAEAASQAVQDMGVEAETLAAESAARVEKTVNPETGAVTLRFGIPKGGTGNPGYSPTIQIATITGGHRITVTDSQGSASFDVMDGEQGNPGTPGDDGYSPAVTITTITGGHRVTITDKTHQSGQTFDVMDGEQGNPGTPGDDGYSPAVTITTITGGHRVTITDKTHPSGQSFDVMDGVIQSVNGKSTASITLDAGDIGYDSTETYNDGTVGKAVSDLNRQISELDALTTAKTWNVESKDLPEVSGSTSVTWLGVKANRGIYTLNGTNTFSGATRVILSGEPHRQSQAVSDVNVKYQFALTVGHRYRAILTELSGGYVCDTVPYNIFIKGAIGNTDLLTGSNVSVNRKIVEFTMTVTGNAYMYLWIPAGELTFNNYTFTVALVDLGIDDETLTALRDNILGIELVDSWIYGKAVTSNTSSVDVDSPVEVPAYRYVIVECNQNDEFIVTLNSGGTHRGWIFLNAEKQVITKASAAIAKKDFKITAPLNTKYLLLQTKAYEDGRFYPCFKNTFRFSDVATANIHPVQKGMLVCAHKGYMEEAPQNSIYAYEMACVKGAYALNMAQVRKSADGTLWVMHDESVSTTTDGTGNIGDLHDDYISGLLINGSQYTDEQRKVPKVYDLLKMSAQYGAIPMIRAAYSGSGSLSATYDSIWEALFDQITKYGLTDSVMFSGSLAQLNMIDKYYPHAPKAFYNSESTTIASMITSFNGYEWKDRSTVYAMVAPTVLSDESVLSLRKNGYGLYSWGGTQEEKETCAGYGVDYINSDTYPGLLPGIIYPTQMQLAYEVSKLTV